MMLPTFPRRDITMRSRRWTWPLGLLLVVASSCDKTPEPSELQNFGTDGGMEAEDDASTGAPVEPEEPTEEPHALGTIVLGEAHDASTAVPTPVVTASFLPQAPAHRLGCGQQISGCWVSTPPTCEACALDEVCGFDEACVPACQRVCDLACGPDEVCYFATPDTPACKRIERFDAGVLTFDGTTVPLTLYPPYSFSAGDSGPLFEPGAAIGVTASGASQAGFEAFVGQFVGTTAMQTELADISLSEAYGTGPLPIAWGPGEDAVRIVVTAQGLDGSYGVVDCEAQDAEGAFDVPRKAIVAAAGPNPAALHVSVERRRVVIVKGVPTKGDLLDTVVAPEGWVELVTSSIETASLQSCSAGYLLCDGACVDPYSSDLHCGDCGNDCGLGYCELGTCYGDVETSGSDDGPIDGDCCVAHGGIGCTDPTVEACVCASDPYCCDTSWDSSCVSRVQSDGCGVCP